MSDVKRYGFRQAFEWIQPLFGPDKYGEYIKYADHKRDLATAHARIAELETERDVWHKNYSDELAQRAACVKRIAELEAERDALISEIDSANAFFKARDNRVEMVVLRDSEHPKNVMHGLQLLADWFDAYYDDAGTGRDQLQVDCRLWADELEKQQERIAELEAAAKSHANACKQYLDCDAPLYRDALQTTYFALVAALHGEKGGDDAK